MMRSATVDLIVGLFVASGVVALFFLAMQVSNLSDFSGDEGYRIYAQFENSGGLKVRSPVTIAGVRIGRVQMIRFDKNRYRAVVEMLIDPDVDTLPTDTSASILTSGLLGEQYIGLTPGGEDTYLRDGDEIELTQSAIVLEEMIGQFLFGKAAEGS